MAECAAYNAAWAATQPGQIMPDDGGLSEARLATELAILCDLLRDIFVPFAAVGVAPAWRSWSGSLIPKLAEAIYDERAFVRLPILGDALEDAGCTDTAILDHCHGPGPHVRGCWVIDLILGFNLPKPAIPPLGVVR
jgi:hypothetical protein